jgi:hypothetical protein
MPTTPINLPTGLKHHCSSCNIVIPSDAPTTGTANCSFVAQHRLAAAFNPNETEAGQFAMAVGAWALIYDEKVSTSEYLAQFYRQRKEHFIASAMKAAMTTEAVANAQQHKRDGWLYQTDPS